MRFINLYLNFIFFARNVIKENQYIIEKQFFSIVCTLAMAKSHKITWLTLKNMGIDIKQMILPIFGILSHSTVAQGILILALGNCRSGEN